MLPQNKKETLLLFLFLAMALGWTVAVCLYGPALFQAIDAALPR